MKIFVDTNIFLDLILKREKFHDALLIFNAIEKKLFEGALRRRQLRLVLGGKMKAEDADELKALFSKG